MKVSYDQLAKDCFALAHSIKRNMPYVAKAQYKNIYAVPFRGVPVAIEMSKWLPLPLIEKEKITKHTLIVLDYIDAGVDLDFPNNDIAVLYKTPEASEVTYHYREYPQEENLEMPYLISE